MWKVCNLSRHERRIYPTLTSFSVIPVLPFPQLLECLSRYMCGYNLTMMFPLDFRNYTGLNGLVNSFSWFTIAPPNELILGWKPRWSFKRKGNNILRSEKWFLEGVLQKNFPKNFLKIHREIPVRQYLTLWKVFRPSALQLY